jgi:hypothetical protein
MVMLLISLVEIDDNGFLWILFADLSAWSTCSVSDGGPGNAGRGPCAVQIRDRGASEDVRADGGSRDLCQALNPGGMGTAPSQPLKFPECFL